MEEQKPLEPAESLESDNTTTAGPGAAGPAGASHDQPEDKKDASGDTPGVISAESGRVQNAKATKPSLPRKLLGWLLGLNVYLLLFIFVLLVTGVVIYFSYSYGKHKSGIGTIGTTTLSQSVLDQLAKSDVTVGTSNQVLNVESSAVFAGQILARSDLEVAGNLTVGKTVTASDINAANSATLGQTSISKDLSVTGNTALQGQVTIAGSLQVGGNGKFTGSISAPQITVGSLQLDSDLNLTHHITAGGGTPNRSSGTALGNGGTASLSGSDTAGSITINTSNNPNAGCLITVNFVTKFNTTPHVLITPIGSAAAGMSYYVNRSTSSFSICTTTTPTANANFGFDYFVLD